MLTKCRPNSRPRALLSLITTFATTMSLLAFPSAASKRVAPPRLDAQAGMTQQTITQPTSSDGAPEARAQEAYGKLSLAFEVNQGQTDERVKFVTRAGGGTVFLTSTEAVFVLSAHDESGHADRTQRDITSRLSDEREVTPSPRRMHALWMKLEGANAAAQVEGVDQLPGIVNYFIGNDPEKWHANIPTYGQVRYTGIYEGVDLEYYGNAERQLEYDFVVKPHADATAVSLSFDGADDLNVESKTGDLLVKTPVGTLRQHKPLVYQETNGVRSEIQSSYELKRGRKVGFRLGAYDRSKSLVIDPALLVYSTYLGGNDHDTSSGIAVDSVGNAYVTGITQSANFPSTPGAFDPTTNPSSHNIDSFVSKLNPGGSALVYSTFIGGDAGLDTALGITVDSSGNVYVTGDTNSSDFPTINAFDATLSGRIDAFVTKLNRSGSALVYSTYLGGDIGPTEAARDGGRGIAVDPAGNAYITGRTNSANFPVTPGAFQTTRVESGLCVSQGNPVICTDAFVTKLNAAGTGLIYSTYLGGTGDDFGNDIAVDSSGSAYITGRTLATNFPGLNGFDTSFNGGPSDFFVTKLNPSGSARVYSTYLGGSGEEFLAFIAVDSAGSAYITGDTNSVNFPTASALDDTLSGTFDAFVTKLNVAGTALVYSTFLGGDNDEAASDIDLDSAGSAYVTGNTTSTNFPVLGAIQPVFGQGTSDAFVTKLSASGTSLGFSTYLGGSSGDSGDGIAVDPVGNAYITGITDSINFPISNALQDTKSAVGDAFVSKLGAFSIWGHVVDTGGNPLGGVALSLNGTSTDFTLTNVFGEFALSFDSPGNYTVAAASNGFTFAPESVSFTNLTNSPGVIFVASTNFPTPTPTPSARRVRLEFDQYIAAEDCNSLPVSVLRTGDSSGALTVDYATSDATAQQRGDYTITLGTLSFAPGDTTKTINVPITEDAFREGDESFTLNLFNLTGPATLEEPSRATIIIADDDASGSTVNPIDDSEDFVCQHYHDFLGRQPDAAGLLFWINNIESCGNDLGCRETKRVDTSAAFFLSIEFQQTGFFALRLQRAAFGKRSDTASTRMTYEELVGDTRRLGDGVIVGQAGFETKIEQNKQAYVTAVVTSPAFIARFPESQTASQYVDALYSSAQVVPTAAERTDAITAFGAGGTAGRVAALRKVAESPSLMAAEFNPAFVLLQFHGYLRRNPTDLPDTSDAGYQFWLAKLNQFGGDFRKAEMVKAFLASIEYRARFGQS